MGDELKANLKQNSKQNIKILNLVNNMFNLVQIIDTSYIKKINNKKLQNCEERLAAETPLNI